jgi:hypothetical protein
MAGILQIGASVNVAELKAGMEEAAAATRGTASQMSAAFEGLAAESRASTAQIASSWVGVAQATLAVKAAQSDVRSATKAAKEANDEDTASVARLAMAERDAATAIAAKKAALDAATGATETAEAADTQFGAGVTGNSMLVRGLGQEIGVGIPRFMASFLGSLAPVAGFLQAAFLPIVIVGFIEILGKAITKVGEMAEAVGGFGEKTKRTYEGILAENEKLYQSYEHVAEAQDKIKSIGLVGEAKDRAEIDNNAKAIARVNEQLKVQEAALARAKTLAHETPGIGALWGSAKVKDAEDAFKEIPGIEENIHRLTRELRDLSQVQRPEVAARAAAEAGKETAANDRSAVDAQKKNALDLLVSREAGIKQAREDYKISAQDELDDLKTISDLKLVATQKYVTDSIALLRQLHARTGENVTPQITGLDEEGTAAAIKNREEKAALDAKFAAEQQRRAHEVASAQIEATASVADAQVRLDDQTARESYASHKATADQETALLLAAENERANAHRTKLQAQLAEDSKEPEKYAKEIIALNGELESAEKDHQAKLAAIRAEGTRKAIEDGRKAAEEEANAAERAARSTLENTLRIDNDKLKHHQVTAAQWSRDEIAAVTTAEKEEIDAAERQLAKLRALGLQETTEYKAVQDREVQIKRQAEQQIEQIDQKALDKYTQEAQRFTNVWTQGLTEVLFKHESVTKMLGQVYEHMVANIIKGIGEWVAAELVGAALHKTIALQGIAVDAKKAAAGAYAAVSDIPIVGPILAPVAAAAAFAGVMAFGSFEQGGIVPINAHPGEMVLPRHISNWVQKAAAGDSGAGGSKGHVFNIHYQPVINHPMTRDDADQHAEYLFGKMRRMANAFNS